MTLTFKQSKLRVALWAACVWVLAIAPCARANVFASNVKLDGTNTNLAINAGESVTINYLLNQDASSVTVAVLSGTSVFWATNLVNAGTNRGVNAVVWPGIVSGGGMITNGLYRVRITATSAGKTNWWKVPMVDNDLEAHNGDGYVWSPWGIAVNNNTNSPYFGRIFVGNSDDSGATAEAGDFKGIGVYNANGSYAIPGGHSTGGWSWNPGGSGDVASPGKIEVGEDDRVYVVDEYFHRATVLNFDQLISTSSPPVFALNNDALFQSSSHIFSGLMVDGSDMNRSIFMTDLNGGAADGYGVRRWAMDTNGVASTNDSGTTVVATGSGLDLDVLPRDIAKDSEGRIYAVQKLGPFQPASPRILGYAPYQGVTLSNAAWEVLRSGTNELDDVVAVAAALHTNWLAVVSISEFLSKPITVYRVTDTNAALLTQEGDGLNPPGDYNYTDVAWDRAGNLYVTDWYDGRWRVFSPPGANSFATTSLQSFKVGPYSPPKFLSVSWKTNVCEFQLAAEIGVTYALDVSSNLSAWTAAATNTAANWTNTWSVPLALPKALLRARVLPQD